MQSGAPSVMTVSALLMPGLLVASLAMGNDVIPFILMN